MSGRVKLTILMAIICAVPSIIEFSKGYLVLSALLFHILIALLFSVVAMSFLSTIVAIFHVQNIERVKRKRLSELSASSTEKKAVEGVTREIPEATS